MKSLGQKWKIHIDRAKKCIFKISDPPSGQSMWVPTQISLDFDSVQSKLLIWHGPNVWGPCSRLWWKSQFLNVSKEVVSCFCVVWWSLVRPPRYYIYILSRADKPALKFHLESLSRNLAYKTSNKTYLFKEILYIWLTLFTKHKLYIVKFYE